MKFVKIMGSVESPTVSYLGMSWQHSADKYHIYCVQSREMSGLLSGDWKVVEALGDIVLEQIHCGMRIFPTSLVATALLQRPHGLQFGK